MRLGDVMTDSSYILMSDFLQAFLPFKILDLRGRGGPSELETEDALKRCSEMLEPPHPDDAKKYRLVAWQGGAELICKLPTSGMAMGVLMRALAVLSFLPGGIEFCGVRYFGREEDERDWHSLQQVQNAETVNLLPEATR